MLGHEKVGSGKQGVIVLNDWLSATSSWDGARPYLDTSRLTYAFTDLRGYGRSKHIEGQYTLGEAAADVLELADSLDWERFSIVGHSMSTLLALHLAQSEPERIRRVALLAPVPLRGFGADGSVLAALQSMARGSDAQRLEALKAMWGDRLSDGWIRFKVERWRASADNRAVEAYAAMFARDGLPNPTATVRAPVLAIAGERDSEPMRSEAARAHLSPICAELSVQALSEVGHYPMQEAPPLLVAWLERFLA